MAFKHSSAAKKPSRNILVHLTLSSASNPRPYELAVLVDLVGFVSADYFRDQISHG
jgi:hypothetical protein